MSKLKPKTRKILLIICCAIVFLSIAILCFLSPNAKRLNQKLPRGGEGVWDTVSAADWMANIDGKTPLGDISLPGSHDSGTQYVMLPMVGRCQDLSIAEQLDAGVRALDIRLCIHEDGRLTISHGFLDCMSSPDIFADELTAESVFEQCYAFLDAHPTETILMLVKHEYGDARPEKVEAQLQDCIGDNTAYWYTENRQPSLEQVRGKIVLARRYGPGNDTSLSGMDFVWEDQGGKAVAAVPCSDIVTSGRINLCVQDRYEYSNENKMNAVSYSLDLSSQSDDSFVLNYLSTKGGSAVGIPKQHARALNSWFIAKELCSNTDYGCIMFDFVTVDLARHVFASNTYISE